jgi:hypothetical protein
MNVWMEYHGGVGDGGDGGGGDDDDDDSNRSVGLKKIKAIGK